jgi:hypothetical protein
LTFARDWVDLLVRLRYHHRIVLTAPWGHVLLYLSALAAPFALAQEIFYKTAYYGHAFASFGQMRSAISENLYAPIA